MQVQAKNAATNSQQTEKAQDAQKIEDKPQYTLDNAITDINKVLASSGCSGKGGVQAEKADFVQVDNSAQFNYQGGKSLINNELTYAYTQYGCGTSGSVGLLKKAGYWVDACLARMLAHTQCVQQFEDKASQLRLSISVIQTIALPSRLRYKLFRQPFLYFKP